MLRSFIQKFLSIVILTASLFLPAFTVENYQIKNQPPVIKKVVQTQQKDNKYHYLKVSKYVIAEALSLIDALEK